MRYKNKTNENGTIKYTIVDGDIYFKVENINYVTLPSAFCVLNIVITINS